MSIFKNIFADSVTSFTANVNMKQVAEVRRAILIKEGYDVNSINWEHYVKVLEAKRKQLIHS